MFSHAYFAICILDDCAVYLMPEVCRSHWKRGYILVILAGGITGIVQINDPHRALKSGCRKKKSQLMLQMLSDHPQKVPALHRNDMLKMLNDSMKTVKFGNNKTFNNFISYGGAVWIYRFFGQ